MNSLPTTDDYARVFDDSPALLAYLFGSRATGRVRANSDYDVAVLFPRELPRVELGHWHGELIGRLMDAFRSDDVDVVVLNDAPPLLRFEAIRPRCVIFNHDDAMRVAFEEQMKPNGNVISARLAQLGRFIARLRELQQHSRDEVANDWRIQSTIERNLQLAVEVVISVSEQIVSATTLPLADTSRATISTLATAQIITPELGAALQDAVGFRNIIVHQYVRIDEARVYDALQSGPAMFAAFLAAINAFLESQP